VVVIELIVFFKKYIVYVDRFLDPVLKLIKKGYADKVLDQCLKIS
jgi:hypothetical protein